MQHFGGNATFTEIQVCILGGGRGRGERIEKSRSKLFLKKSHLEVFYQLSNTFVLGRLYHRILCPCCLQNQAALCYE